MTNAGDLFERARSADIAAVAGVKLFAAGQRLRGECPLCHASAGKKGGGAFSVDPKARIFYCFGCLEGGDVVRLEQLLREGSLRDAAMRLTGDIELKETDASRARRDEAARAARIDQERATQRSLGRAARIWETAWKLPIGETLAGTYLRARGLDGALVASVGKRLRFHPAAPWSWDEPARRWITAPAMVGRGEAPEGPPGGVHVTYLAADGSGKARLEPAKRMIGPQKDASGRPGGVWLRPPAKGLPTLVGEGIETTLAAAQLQAMDGVKIGGVVATLSLTALQGGWLADKWGRIDPEQIAANPEQPAFTWPGQGAVIVAVDRDMGGIEVKVRAFGGGTVRRRLEAEDRARICAGLATAAWKRAGANAVRVIAPGPGRDFNDELRGRWA